MLRSFVFLLFLPICVVAQEHYDLVLKGGRVIDPHNGKDEVLDVAIRDHKVVAVAKKIGPADADKVVEVSGLIVVPGLVDIHTHVYAGTAWL